MMRNIFQGKAGEFVDAREAFSMKAGDFVDAGKAFSMRKNIQNLLCQRIIFVWLSRLFMGRNIWKKPAGGKN